MKTHFPKEKMLCPRSRRTRDFPQIRENKKVRETVIVRSYWAQEEKKLAKKCQKSCDTVLLKCDAEIRIICWDSVTAFSLLLFINFVGMSVSTEERLLRIL